MWCLYRSVWFVLIQLKLSVVLRMRSIQKSSLQSWADKHAFIYNRYVLNFASCLPQTARIQHPFQRLLAHKSQLEQPSPIETSASIRKCFASTNSDRYKLHECQKIRQQLWTLTRQWVHWKGAPAPPWSTRTAVL